MQNRYKRGPTARRASIVARACSSRPCQARVGTGFGLVASLPPLDSTLPVAQEWLPVGASPITQPSATLPNENARADSDPPEVAQGSGETGHITQGTGAPAPDAVSASDARPVQAPGPLQPCEAAAEPLPEWLTEEAEGKQCQVFLVTFAAVLAARALNADTPLRTLEGVTRETLRDALIDAVRNPCAEARSRGGRQRSQ